MNKKVSIITPVKNLISKDDANNFVRLIESIQKQTYNNIEHIVIDGASTDGTSIILSSFKDVFSYVCEPDLGVADALNKGVLKATGDYVMFLNAGDFLTDETSIQKAVEVIEQSESDFVYSSSWALRPTGQKFEKKVYIGAAFKNMPFAFQSAVFKKKIIEDEGLFNPDYHFVYGYDLILRLLLNNAVGREVLHKTSTVGISQTLKNNKEQSEMYVVLKNAYEEFSTITEEKIIQMLLLNQFDVPFLEEFKAHIHPKMANEVEKLFQTIKGRCSVFEEYKKQGYDTLYVPLFGIGDALLFAPIARCIFEKTGKKVLVGHKNIEIFKNNPYVEATNVVFDRIDVLNEQEILKLQKMGFKVIYPSYWISKKFPTGYWGKTYPKQHIIAQSFAVCGFKGKVELKPEIYLTNEEKEFGRFARPWRKQVAIMSSALLQRKQWPYFQDLINALKDECDFVQIGGPEDKCLDGVAFQQAGKLTLRQTASVLYNSDLFVGEIGGLMHLARAVDCPAVIAYCSEPIYAASYSCNTNILSESPCMIPQTGTIDKNCDPCPNNYQCSRLISVPKMVQAVREKLKNLPIKPLFVDTAVVEPLPCDDFLDYRRKQKESSLVFEKKI